MRQLEIEKRDWLLKELAFYRAAHKVRSAHQIWQEGSHPKALISDAIFEQKLEYLHNNPMKRGWVAPPDHWRYSSAHEWCAGATPVIRCDRWR